LLARLRSAEAGEKMVVKRIEELDDARRLQLLIEGVIDYAIYTISIDGLVVSWNTGARRLKGYEPAEIIGKPYATFFTPEDRARGVPERALQTARREGRFEAEGWRVRKDGTRFWALGVIGAVRDESGELIGFAKITRDMTEREEAQRALREAQEQLAASQKMEAIGQLTGGIAHDFNNLLMIVLGNLETAQRHARSTPPVNPNLERSIANAVRGAQRAAALTSRLLAFSRRQPLNPKPLDVNRFLTGVADFLQRSLGETIQVEMVGSAGLWRIEADPNHLETALVNLAINARDAMPGGGKVTIEAANIFADEHYCMRNPEVAPGQYVVICVSDTGVGMSPEVMSRAFEPFFTTKEIGHGTGLGLSQVYGFVKQSGGNVKIYSEVGHGTTVKIYLPRYASTSDVEEQPVSEVLGQGEQGEVILVVEDDSDLRDYLCEVLRELGYQVLTAIDGVTALPILEETSRRIDLLLTDVVMPGINGRQLAARAQELRPELPVLYMTGYSRNAVVHHGRLDPGVELLQKPVTQSELAARVRDLLDKKTGEA